MSVLLTSSRPVKSLARHLVSATALVCARLDLEKHTSNLEVGRV